MNVFVDHRRLLANPPYHLGLQQLVHRQLVACLALVEPIGILLQHPANQFSATAKCPKWKILPQISPIPRSRSCPRSSSIARYDSSPGPLPAITITNLRISTAMGLAGLASASRRRNLGVSPGFGQVAFARRLSTFGRRPLQLIVQSHARFMLSLRDRSRVVRSAAQASPGPMHSRRLPQTPGSWSATELAYL